MVFLEVVAETDADVLELLNHVRGFYDSAATWLIAVLGVGLVVVGVVVPVVIQQMQRRSFAKEAERQRQRYREDAEVVYKKFGDDVGEVERKLGDLGERMDRQVQKGVAKAIAMSLQVTVTLSKGLEADVSVGMGLAAARCYIKAGMAKQAEGCIDAVATNEEAALKALDPRALAVMIKGVERTLNEEGLSSEEWDKRFARLRAVAGGERGTQRAEAQPLAGNEEKQ